MKLLISFLLFFEHLIGSGNCIFPCKLVWIQYSFGDVVPAHGIEISESRLIAKITLRKTFGDDIFVTTFTLDDKVVYGNGTIYPTFELLTNPFGCKLGWKLESSSDIGYHVNLKNKGLLVRSFSNMTWVPSILDGEHHENSQYLTSSTDGFHVTLTQVTVQKFGITPPTADDMNFEFLGQDVIDNRSPIQISQTVVHSKQISRSNFEDESELQHDSTIQSIWHDTRPTETTDTELSGTANSNRKGTSTSAVNQVSISRSLLITANTKIQVCTLIRMMDATAPFSAKAIFTLAGYSGKEIGDIIIQKSLPYKVEKIEKNYVIVAINGTRRDNFELETKLFVFDVDGPCPLLREAVEGWNAFKNGFNVTNVAYYKRVIENYFSVER